MIQTDTSLFERAVARISSEGARPESAQVRPAAPAVTPAMVASAPPQAAYAQPAAFLASAADIRIGDPRTDRELRGTRQPWQERAWAMYAELGIVWFAVEWGANALSRHRLVAARKVRPDDEPEPAAPDSFPQQLVDDLGRGVPTPAGMDGLASLMHDLGTNLRTPGECYLLGTEEGGKVSSYDVVSTDEVSLMGNRLVRRRWPGAPPEVLSPEAVLKRIWRPDARWSGLATSPLKGALIDLERLSLLKAGGMAALRSRVALAGLFTIPSEIEFPQVDPDLPPPTFDGILMEAMETSVQDARSIGRFVPLILKAKAEYLKPDVLRKITLYDPAASQRDAEEAEAIVRQFAMGIDLPPEVLLGMADMNHWSAWMVSEQAREAIRPTVELAVAGLTFAYLRPALEFANWPNPEEWVIWFDDSDFGVDRDRIDDANAAFDRDAISWDAYRKATNWQPDDAPSEEELTRRIAIKLGDAGAALSGESTGATRAVPVPGGPPLPVAPASPIPPPTANGRPPAFPEMVPPEVAPPITGAATNGHGRAGRLRTLSRQLAAIDRELMNTLIVSSDRAVRRAAWRAGSKIRSSLAGNGRKATLAEMVRRKDNDVLARELGRAGLATLQIEEDDLFDGTGEAFIREVRPDISTAQLTAVRRTARALDLDPDEMEDLTQTMRRTSLERSLASLERGFSAVAVSFVMAGARPQARGEVSHLVAPRDAIRQAMALAGGTAGAGSLATGPLVGEILHSQGARFGTGFAWDYTGIARSTFPGHLMLDNREFAGPDDDDLRVRAEDEWLGVPYYEAGDHDGCCCLTVPTIEEG